jgi:hypothetical protein
MKKIGFFAPRLVLGPLQISSPTYTADVSETLFTGTVEDIDDGYYPTRDVVEEFANCRIEVAAVRRFTTRYGPLWTTRADKQFAFRLCGWDSQRWQFRQIWDQLLGLPPREADLKGLIRPQIRDYLERVSRIPIRFVEASGGRFEYSAQGDLVFVAGTLFQALVLTLWSLGESGKLRRCLRPDCDYLPYFITEHGRQHYCSEKCGAWAQQQWKKTWWKTHGQQWREKRSGSIQGKRKSKNSDITKKKIPRAAMPK